MSRKTLRYPKRCGQRPNSMSTDTLPDGMLWNVWFHFRTDLGDFTVRSKTHQ